MISSYIIMCFQYQVLKDVSELINLTFSQAQDHQPLSGSTTFNRIELPASSDPLNGNLSFIFISVLIYDTLKLD